jgi:RNA polymerase sigma-70 factor (ECF subfamily)
MFTRELVQKTRQVRNEFLDLVQDLRPGLYRYCRSLAGNAWDAEDLVQETLVRTWSRVATRSLLGEIEHPRAYLFRIATNTFLDTRRREGLVETAPDLDPAGEESPALPGELEEALGSLATRLPPRERAAVLLKDVFDFSLAEAARQLRTTIGAVKAALHRGRARLRRAEAVEGPAPRHRRHADHPLLARFVAAFNARDLDGLMALFREDAEAEILGCLNEEGRRAIRDGSIVHTLFEPDGTPLPDHSPRAEIAELEGEPLVLLTYRTDAGEDGLGDILRFDFDGAEIARLRYYYFSPDVLSEIAQLFGMAVRPNGYRY